MTTAAAGWYPDPEGRVGRRYWDGTAWTEHFAKDPIFDGELRRSMRKKSDRVTVTDDRLTKGDDTIAFADVEHVAYWVMVHKGGALSGTKQYHFRLWGGPSDVMLDFGVLPRDATFAYHERAFDVLVETSKRFVEPMLRQRALARVEAGETVSIGGIDASRAGLAHGRKDVTWSDYGHVAFEHSYLRVFNRSGKEVLKGNGGTDGPLAGEFFALCADGFGRTGGAQQIAPG